MTAFFLMPPAQGGDASMTWVLWGLVFLIFYMFMIRPQMNKQKKQDKFRDTVDKGDNIVTAGGVHGRVVEASEGKSSVVMQTEGGHKLRVERGAISEEYTKSAYHSKDKDEKKTLKEAKKS